MHLDLQHFNTDRVAALRAQQQFAGNRVPKEVAPSLSRQGTAEIYGAGGLRPDGIQLFSRYISL